MGVGSGMDERIERRDVETAMGGRVGKAEQRDKEAVGSGGKVRGGKDCTEEEEEEWRGTNCTL